jgi:Mor family transcriptional regulator
VDRYEIVGGERRTVISARNRQIYEMRLADAKYADLGKQFGISTVRVGQIVRRVADIVKLSKIAGRPNPL